MHQRVKKKKEKEMYMRKAQMFWNPKSPKSKMQITTIPEEDDEVKFEDIVAPDFEAELDQLDDEDDIEMAGFIDTYRW
eukprot:TRINITY_DN19_c0_g1_i1.p2 TRINITY_DN19_c0_g1~~TRINITY_DN19_c0_g1_i1.p2  ORF type:complete len:78 (-),score=26.94 TRINITY_DN19_c0_g1_i1:376-609(-)